MLRLQQVTFMALHNFLGLSYELIASVSSTVVLTNNLDGKLYQRVRLDMYIRKTKYM